MYILVINSGSSSVKFALYEVHSQRCVAKGGVFKIGEPSAYLESDHGGTSHRTGVTGDTHHSALESILGALLASDGGMLSSLDEILAVGHRVVHGGSMLRKSALVDDRVLDQVTQCIPFAPLHNPPNLAGIVECRRLLPETPQVVVPDTSFHQTMPPEAYMYALPYDLFADHGMRRYGFHGTSYRYVSRRAAHVLGSQAQELRMVVCHLGNGASMAAIKRGRSVDTTMGMTPVEGLMMGTRSGDVDAGLVVQLLAARGEASPENVDALLNRQSGILGISGVSNDLREVSAHAASGDLRCILALDMYAYRVKKYVGAYAAAMHGLDVLVFTAGVGENSPEVRASVCDGLGFLGICIDPDRNNLARGVESDISAPGASVRSLVIPTDEEAVIVQDTLMLVEPGLITR